MGRGKKWIVVYIFVVFLFILLIRWGSRTISVMAEKQSIPRKNCIVIDAGHGGEDGGATSCTGKLESRFNLEIALKLNDLFHLLGYQTKMIRTEDVSVYTKGETISQRKISDLKERVRIVNESEDGILISIHQNMFSDSRYSGAQVFYAETEGSKELASKLQSKLVEQLNAGSKRKIKKSEGIYLMEHVEKVAILIECGFLSNVQEEAKLQKPEYQRKLSCVIAATVAEYLSNT